MGRPNIHVTAAILGDQLRARRVLILEFTLRSHQRSRWDSGISSNAQEWDAVLEVRLKNREAFHGLAALLFVEGSESLNRAAVVRHPNLLVVRRTDAGCPQGDR
jgi:hypothetical protein